MTNATPAQHLAAVLRVVAPGDDWKAYGENAAYCAATGTHIWMTLDGLARVVAMLTEEQTRAFDDAIGREVGWGRAAAIMPSATLKLKTAQILAALVAAVGLDLTGKQQ